MDYSLYYNKILFEGIGAKSVYTQEEVFWENVVQRQKDDHYPV